MSLLSKAQKKSNDGRALTKREERRLKKEESKIERTYAAYPILKEIKPHQGMIFHSDYFQVDDYYCCILMYRHNSAARDNFGPFWGINKIPVGLDKSITTINFEQISRMSDSWIADHQSRAEGVAEMNEKEQYRAGSNKIKNEASRSQMDLAIISQELNDGASYLKVQDRIMVKAPTLEALEDALVKIERLYADRFATLTCAPFVGDQRRELANLFGKNKVKRGKGHYYTSTEYAGAYSLVTHGLEDPTGEYVGNMTGDINNSAVIFDVDAYRHHIVVASSQVNEGRMRIGRAGDVVRMSDMWGSKIGQAALLNGHRVVHILLDNVNLDWLGPKFESITHQINMNSGDVNMFEMFGDSKDELSIFPSHMQKLILMAEQAYETNDNDRAIIRGSLEDVATKFYIDNRMWYENAGEHRDRLRVVGIPHDEVPLLQMFCAYLDTEYKSLVNAVAKDNEKLHALSILAITFRNLLSNNGDLFNVHTTSKIDNVIGGRRVIYDFGSLLERGKGVAMAQLVNIIDFACAQLGRGDVVIVHAAENIHPDVREYVTLQFEKLWKRGGRVAYIYNSVGKCLDDADFNKFDEASYTLFGPMSDNIVTKYQEKLGSDIPPDLANLITDKNSDALYIRRGYDNVVFRQDLQLDIEDRKKRRV